MPTLKWGFPGGTLFVGLFYFAFEGLRSNYDDDDHERDDDDAYPDTKIDDDQSEATDPAFLRLRPYLIAMIAGYAMGIFSLSRNYIVPTYMIFGIVAAYQRVAMNPERPRSTVWTKISASDCCMASVSVLVAIKVFLASGGPLMRIR